MNNGYLPKINQLIYNDKVWFLPLGNRTNWRDPASRGGFDPDRNRSNGLQRGGFDRDKGRRSRTSESWDDEGNVNN